MQILLARKTVCAILLSGTTFQIEEQHGKMFVPKLVGRAEECVILRNLLNSNRPEFLALYGRRRVGRVGKTSLIRKSLQVRSLDEGNWQEMQNSPAWNSWQGYAFEAICYKHISQIRKCLTISPTAVANSCPKVKSSEFGAQIDLLFDRKDDAITLCEIKYSNKQFVIDKQYARNLIHKRDTFVKNTRTKKQLFIVMIASNGVKNNLYVDNLISGIVTLDDLFKGG